MPDYKTMYLSLFKAVTKAIYDLQAAQVITEELFISEDDEEHKAPDNHK